MADAARNDQPVLVAYAATLDGFIKLWPKAIRNPSSLFLVSMQEWTFQQIATHASPSGQFYIPAEGLDSLDALRALVQQKETT
jgi:hypothetical protein